MSSFFDRIWPRVSDKITTPDIGPDLQELRLLHIKANYPYDIKEHAEIIEKRTDATTLIKNYHAGIAARMIEIRADLERDFGITLKEIERREAALKGALEIVVSTLRDAGRPETAELVRNRCAVKVDPFK